MKAALIGFMQSGKSTILSTISRKALPAIGLANIEEGMVPVPDGRLDWLTEIYKPKKTTHATIECMDVPGFDFTSEHGRAAAKRFIGNIRTVDLLVWVIRGFEDPSVPPYKDSVNPTRDLDELKTELLLADLELVTTRIDRLEKQTSKPTKTQSTDKAELALYKRLQEAIESEKPIRSAIEHESEMEMIKSLGFLTVKPMVVAVNVGEGQLEQKYDFTGMLEGTVPVITMCVKLEYELSQLDKESRRDFMKDLGIQQAAADKFVNACYSALGYISFLTTGADEVRAWPIRKGTTALDAAGKIHSDIKRGFIRAETFSYEDLRKHGDEKALKAAGRMRLEGKEYIVQDGDIINFRFNV